MDDHNKEKQKQRINKAMIQMQKDNKSINDVFDDYEYLSKYLSHEDIVFFRNRIIEFRNKYSEKLEKYIEENYVPQTKCNANEVNKKEFELKWQEITPYTILGIEQKEYTKEELLSIVELQIKCCQLLGKNEEIDSILDAYNELTKTYSKKK